MEQIIHIDGRGRKYKAYQDGEAVLIIGPPEDLFDDSGMPESSNRSSGGPIIKTASPS